MKPIRRLFEKLLAFARGTMTELIDMNRRDPKHAAYWEWAKEDNERAAAELEAHLRRLSEKPSTEAELMP